RIPFVAQAAVAFISTPHRISFNRIFFDLATPTFLILARMKPYPVPVLHKDVFEATDFFIGEQCLILDLLFDGFWRNGLISHEYNYALFSESFSSSSVRISNLNLLTFSRVT